jgi:hypothetical protein
MPSTNSHLKIFMFVTVKYNLEAILMIVYYLIDDMIIDIHGIQVRFFPNGSPFKIKNVY